MRGQQRDFLVTFVCGTVLPEIFVRVLFPLNFVVGVGLRKLSERNFLLTRKFDRVDFISTARGVIF